MSDINDLLKDLIEGEPDEEFNAQWKEIEIAPHGSVFKLGYSSVEVIDAKIATIETFAHLEKKYGISSADVHKSLVEQKAWVAAGNHTVKPGSLLEKIEVADRRNWNFHLEMYLNGGIGTLDEIPDHIKNSGI